MDRLLRVGSELDFALCEIQEIEIVIIHKGDQPSFEEELATDLLIITTVFSARLYDASCKKNQQIIETLQSVIDDTTKNQPMLLARKIVLDPNKAQRDYFAHVSSVARFDYNWAWPGGSLNTRRTASLLTRRCLAN